MSRERCTRCGVLIQVPPGIQTLRCPRCYTSIVCSNNNGYVVPPAGLGYAYANNYCPPRNNFYPTANGNGPYRLPWMSSQAFPLPVLGKKRAVLIGICYHGQLKNLKGSVNDVRLMSNLLVNRLGFPKESILVLTEEEMDSSRMPTKRNIQLALSWLVQGCQSGDSLVFYYSGLGSQVRDLDGDEPDGYDEALCPVDYQLEGKILDDEINATIVRPLPHGVKLHAIIDASFSGTFLDLPFVCKMNEQGYLEWEDHRVSAFYKGSRGGTAICISACDDHQNSGDTPALTSGIITSLMTYCFVQAVENERGFTYGSLIQSICNKIRDCEAQKYLYGPYAPPTPQVPQLSSTEVFEIYSKPFLI